MGSAEASWRLFGFPIHDEQPCVVRLAVHLQDEHLVYTRLGQDQQQIQRVAQNASTTLIGWFAANAAARQRHALAPNDPVPLELTTLYHNFPEHFRWDKARKMWLRRERAPVGGFLPVGRMYYVDVREGERFYLRVLLTHVPGATSFDDLLTTGQGTPQMQVHPSFQAACRARGLLQDDTEWERCLREAALKQMPYQIRSLFATICDSWNAQNGIARNEAGCITV